MFSPFATNNFQVKVTILYICCLLLHHLVSAHIHLYYTLHHVLTQSDHKLFKLKEMEQTNYVQFHTKVFTTRRRSSCTCKPGCPIQASIASWPGSTTWASSSVRPQSKHILCNLAHAIKIAHDFSGL